MKQTPLTKSLKHPMQPIGRDREGVIRFKGNAIIEWLFETGKIDLNEIAILAARGKFPKEDQMQLAQLLGYSAGGYSELSYVTRRSFEEVGRACDRLNKECRPRPDPEAYQD